MIPNLQLFRHKFYDGRSGTVEGLILTTQEQIDAHVGQEIYYGEILGKHSEVYGPFLAEDFSPVPVSQETVNDLYTVFGTTVSGYNPFHYILEEEE